MNDAADQLPRSAGESQAAVQSALAGRKGTPRAVHWLGRALQLVIVASAGCLAGLVATTLIASERAVDLLAAGCAAAAAVSSMGLYVLSRDERAARLAALARADDHVARGIERLEDLKWELSENEVRYRSLLDSQQDAIVRRDRDGRIVFANRSFCRLAGAGPETVIGSTLALTVIAGDTPPPIGDGPARRRSYAQLVATARGERWIEWEEQLLSGGSGDDLEVQAVGHDVTESRKAEAELAEARDAAEAASRAKSRFLASMSHEIRTPMNGILGMSGLLLDMPQPPEQRTYVQAIDQSARTLLALIDEILDFSKIEAGKLVLQEEAFALEDCVQACVELLAPRAHEKGLELAWSADPALPLVMGDSTRTRQILLNLLSNAVKFTDRGGVLVSVREGEAMGDGRVTIRIAVEDTGIGLDEADMRALFAEFEQAETAVKRQQGGTGLGLAISKRLARAMGGDITVASRRGTGSTFTAELPLRAVSPRRGPASPAPGPAHVLLAFDRKLERRALAEQLAFEGVAATETDLIEAGEAVAAAERSGSVFTHIVVDAEGELDLAGALVARVRAGAADGAVAQGLVLVGVMTRASLSGFRAHGFETYMVRPVRPAAAREQLCGRELSARSPALPMPSPKALLALPSGAAGAVSAACRVLLAEDNEINALLARKVVERSGGEVHWVKNGREAVAAIRAAIEDQGAMYDVVLMDIFMPEVDGLEATAQIKTLFEARGPGVPACPPIVALTANAFPEDRARYLAAGMDAYLAKPFDKSDLEALLAGLARGRPVEGCPGEASAA